MNNRVPKVEAAWEQRYLKSLRYNVLSKKQNFTNASFLYGHTYMSLCLNLIVIGTTGRGIHWIQTNFFGINYKSEVNSKEILEFDM